MTEANKPKAETPKPSAFSQQIAAETANLVAVQRGAWKFSELMREAMKLSGGELIRAERLGLQWNVGPFVIAVGKRIWAGWWETVLCVSDPGGELGQQSEGFEECGGGNYHALVPSFKDQEYIIDGLKAKA